MIVAKCEFRTTEGSEAASGDMVILPKSSVEELFECIRGFDTDRTLETISLTVAMLETLAGELADEAEPGKTRERVCGIYGALVALGRVAREARSAHKLPRPYYEWYKSLTSAR